ncbi:hypothetical protein ABPG72_018648 [Tetrahymena utriculariae]
MIINLEGKTYEDAPLLGETTLSRTYLVLSMLFCSLVHFICLSWVKDALGDMMVYLFLCLIISPVIFMLFIVPTDKAFTYYLTGEMKINKNNILTIIVMSFVSFGLNFLISLALVKELINLYDGDILSIPVPVHIDKSPYMTLFYLVFVIVMPIVEESFWRIYIPKSFSISIESYIMISLMYGFMNFVILYSIFGHPIYGLIGFIYAILVHFIFTYIHQHNRAIGLMLVSFGMRAGIAMSLYFFLFLKIRNAKYSSPSQPNSLSSSMHDHN